MKPTLALALLLWVLFFALLWVLPVKAADVVPCKTRVSVSEHAVGYWRYRLVSGKRCWYMARVRIRTSRHNAKVFEPPKPGFYVEVVRWDEFNHIDALAPAANRWDILYENRERENERR